MRRLSKISAFAAGVIATLVGLYVMQPRPSAAPSPVTQAGFSPNSLLIDTNLKLDHWDAF